MGFGGEEVASIDNLARLDKSLALRIVRLTRLSPMDDRVRVEKANDIRSGLAAKNISLQLLFIY